LTSWYHPFSRNAHTLRLIRSTDCSFNPSHVTVAHLPRKIPGLGYLFHLDSSGGIMPASSNSGSHQIPVLCYRISCRFVSINAFRKLNYCHSTTISPFRQPLLRKKFYFMKISIHQTSLCPFVRFFNPHFVVFPAFTPGHFPVPSRKQTSHCSSFHP